MPREASASRRDWWPRALTGKAGAARTDERLIALYLDMLAAERGAGTNTLAAYGRDLADFTAHLTRPAVPSRTRDTEDLRAYLGELARRGMRRDGGAAAVGDPPALPLSLRGGAAQGRSGCGARRSEARPRVAENTHASPRSIVCCARRRHDPGGALPARLRAARLACLRRDALRHGLACFRTRRAAATAARRDARFIVVRGKGNKERLVPLNDAAKSATANYLALLARSRP